MAYGHLSFTHEHYNKPIISTALLEGKAHTAVIEYLGLVHNLSFLWQSLKADREMDWGRPAFIECL